jgi:hypothetical protein
MNRWRSLPRAALAASLVLIPPALEACDWPQFDLDPQHSGNNTSEIFLSASNVGNLAQLYQVALRGVADGAPVFLARVPTASGVKDLLFVTTKSGYIQALDAHTGVELWNRRPATGPNYTTSSPAVDPDKQYVYSYGLEGRVHKYQVGNGSEITTGGWPQLATLKPDVEKGSSALGFATSAGGTSYLYCTNGGYPGDAGDYQGHVTAINLATGSQNVFNAACSDLAIHFVENGTPGVNDCARVQNAIWARPGAVYDPATDRIYMATGNGGYAPASHNWSETVFSLNPDGSGSTGDPLDSYTPTNFQSLDNSDADLGSTSPVILPLPAGSTLPHVAAQCGKDGQVRLINLDNMSGQGGPGHTGGELQLINVPQGNEVLPSPATWVNPADGTPWIFISSYNGISGLKVTLNAGTPQLTPVWQRAIGSVSSPIVANNVLYFFNGTVHAASPTTGADLKTDSSLGGIHWESPVVANGILYITDESGQLTAYTIQGGFADVPASNPLHVQVDAIARNGVTAGCGGGNFCPSNAVVRSSMAVFLLRGEHGACYVPPAAAGIFSDVPAGNAFAPWIEQLYNENITGGCSTNPLSYCPGNAVIRASMAVFLLRAEHGSAYTPPACTGLFADVACPSPFAGWIEQLYNEGITGGCSTNPLRYCPSNAVTRAQMAIFIVTTFQLQ